MHESGESCELYPISTMADSPMAPTNQLRRNWTEVNEPRRGKDGAQDMLPVLRFNDANTPHQHLSLPQ